MIRLPIAYAAGFAAGAAAGVILLGGWAALDLVKWVRG
jgi:hypothetical protein